jgi:predicted transposase/invertase (TIGR01784 family)
MKSKYINPFTDFGFKKIFGEEASKPLLMDFLQSLLPDAMIAELSFKNKEKLEKSSEDRKAIFDIYCENQKGEKIIVELQKAKQNYFKDRTVFYSTFPIQEQSESGDWNYKLKAVYCIGILDFSFEEKYSDAPKEVVHTVQLKDQNHQIFYNKLTFIYLEMPHFTKEIHQLKTQLDKWLYFIKHLEDFQVIPEIFKETVFLQAFKKAEIANFNEAEKSDYHESLKSYRDLNNTMDTKFDEGKIEGKIEERNSMAKLMKLADEPIDKIIKYTGLSKDEIDSL